MVYGLSGGGFKKSSGRPPKLTAMQKAELKGLFQAGPQACGFPGGCWRTPLIQALIEQRFGVGYNVFYLAEFLKNLGFSYFAARTFKITRRYDVSDGDPLSVTARMM